jgi:hypothetical protein
MTTPDGTFRGHIVVTFGGTGDCPLSHCPMSSYGPFPTSQAAREFADRLPAWQVPHILRLDTAAAAILADGTRGT